MSKKKDPNIILRDKRLRAIVQRKKNAVKETAGFNCPFLNRMIDEDYELMERIIRLEHFVWKVEIEPQKDEKTGKICSEIVVLGEFTDEANGLDKKDRELLVKQHKHMMCYEDTLEDRMVRICERLAMK